MFVYYPRETDAIAGRSLCVFVFILYMHGAGTDAVILCMCLVYIIHVGVCARRSYIFIHRGDYCMHVFKHGSR